MNDVDPVLDVLADVRKWTTEEGPSRRDCCVFVAEIIRRAFNPEQFDWSLWMIYPRRDGMVDHPWGPIEGAIKSRVVAPHDPANPLAYRPVYPDGIYGWQWYLVQAWDCPVSGALLEANEPLIDPREHSGHTFLWRSIAGGNSNIGIRLDSSRQAGVRLRLDNMAELQKTWPAMRCVPLQMRRGLRSVGRR